MKLSRVERWILANQCRILEKLYPDEAQRYAKDRQALAGGYELHYGWLAEGILDEHHCLTEDECKEVMDILAMFKALHYSYEELTDKSGIQKPSVQFGGFSGNTETKELGYAAYLGDRFPELDTDRNSHIPLLPLYRKMLEEWKKEDDLNQIDLSKDAIKRITSVSWGREE